jgi:hypothetical protein
MKRPISILVPMTLFAGVVNAVDVDSHRPTIFWVSEPVLPGEAAMVIGDALDAPQKVLISGQSLRTHRPETVEAKILGVSSRYLAFEIPATLKPGTVTLQIITNGGSARSELNEPTVLWTQGDEGKQATPGGWIRIFGRSFDLVGRIRIRLRNIDRFTTTIKANSSSAWDASFQLPTSVGPGRYDIELLKSSDGWRKVSEIEIIERKIVPQRFSVIRDGAVGNGNSDDTSAVKKTISHVAQSGGGVAFFPKGRYRLKGTIDLPPGVSLEGESKNASSLFWSDTNEPPDVLILGQHDSHISNLTMYSSNYRHFISNDTSGGNLGNISIDNVVIRANPYRGHLTPEQMDLRYRSQLAISGSGGDLVRLRGENVKVTNSDLQAGSRVLALIQPQAALISGNRLSNGRLGWYSISGPNGVIFENNVVTGGDLTSSGGGINTLDGSTSAQNVFFSKNKFEGLYGWDREAVTSDGGFGYFYGSAISSNQRVMLSKWVEGRGRERPNWTGAALFVLGGTGMGQVRTVKTVDLDTWELAIDQKFDVDLDDSSVVSIVPMQRNFIFYKNFFADAGMAIQYYGTSLNHVAAENESVRTAGFMNSGRWYRHYQPSWFCQFLRNRIVEGNVYRGGANNAMESGEAAFSTLGLQRPPNRAPLVLGTVYRQNEIDSIGKVVVSGVDEDNPGVMGVLIEAEPEQLKRITIDKGVSDYVVRPVQGPVQSSRLTK